jgi:hypothetical protein
LSFPGGPRKRKKVFFPKLFSDFSESNTGKSPFLTGKDHHRKEKVAKGYGPVTPKPTTRTGN